ncbi:MAG: AAA family ATPase, partial [Novosphingobium sp.]|nr:AAA family ATPase [Novosphingobium sp.]
DVREIIEAVRYAAVSARYKIYIIDEVHMLSRNAFNALLKTLEEPPAHVKFLFATTEVDKLPVTVLSRCQRFDLRRIQTPVLAAHFGKVCAAESVQAEDEALAMIAAAAEGSVRDGLSILDQAISHADMASDGETGGAVTAEQVREMLGLADKTMQRRLFAAVIGGKGDGVLEEVASQFALGIEPAAMMRAQLDLVHKVTVAQISGAADARSSEERAALEGWAKTLGAGALHRLWQLLLKGYDEVRGAPDPLVAAQMALLRVMHAADLPDPGGLIKQLEAFAANPPAMQAAAPAGGSAPVAAAPPSAEAIARLWAQLVEQVEQVSPLIGSAMRLSVRVISLTSGHLVYALAPGIAGDPTADMRRGLEGATGGDWRIERSAELADAMPSLEEARAAEAAREEAALREDPLVRAAFAAFPGAEILDESAISAPTRKPWSKRA